MAAALTIISWISKGAAVGEQVITLLDASRDALQESLDTGVDITEAQLDSKLADIKSRHDRIQNTEI